MYIPGAGVLTEYKGTFLWFWLPLIVLLRLGLNADIHHI